MIPCNFFACLLLNPWFPIVSFSYWKKVIVRPPAEIPAKIVTISTAKHNNYNSSNNDKTDKNHIRSTEMQLASTSPTTISKHRKTFCVIFWFNHWKTDTTLWTGGEQNTLDQQWPRCQQDSTKRKASSASLGAKRPRLSDDSGWVSKKNLVKDVNKLDNSYQFSQSSKLSRWSWNLDPIYFSMKLIDCVIQNMLWYASRMEEGHDRSSVEERWKMMLHPAYSQELRHRWRQNESLMVKRGEPFLTLEEDMQSWWWKWVSESTLCPLIPPAAHTCKHVTTTQS